MSCMSVPQINFPAGFLRRVKLLDRAKIWAEGLLERGGAIRASERRGDAEGTRSPVVVVTKDNVDRRAEQ